MSKTDRVKKRRLYVGSGVDDIALNEVTTNLNEYGQYEPSRVDDASKVMLNGDFSEGQDVLAGNIFSDIKDISFNDKIGHYLQNYAGHVSKGGYRERASSGGMVSWVAAKLLESGKIDGFIHVKKSSKEGLLFEYAISRSVEEIHDGAKSRYYPNELSNALKEVKKKPGRYAVVGIPEIITEVRLLAEQDSTIKERIVYYFGLVCGHQKTTKYAEAIAWEYGIKPGDLKDIDFRVKRVTGKSSQYDMKFTGSVDGREVTFTVGNTDPFVHSWAHGFFKARFSDFTDDSFNELADITFGDAWLKEYLNDPQGDNIVIVRNHEIRKLIERGIKDKELVLDTVDADTIIRSQKGLLHHTRDELPYRLYKELDEYGWAPKKRVKPSNRLDSHRKQVQDVRQKIAEESHIHYKKAVELNDFNYFKDKMTPYVNEYRQLYGQQIDKPHQEVVADGAITTLSGYHNYGNVIQRYALQKFLKDNGYNFVSYIDNTSRARVYRSEFKVALKTPLRAFKRFMNYQKPYWYTPTIGELYKEVAQKENIVNFVNENIWVKDFDPRDNYGAYITGSDQVWRNWWSKDRRFGLFFFDFLKGRKAKRIAYAASFGKDDMTEVMSADDVEYVRPYISKFDAISVREKSGIKMIKDTWGISGVKNVIDPTLLLDASVYSDLIDKSEARYDQVAPIFAYIIGETDGLNMFIRRVQDDRKMAVSRIRVHAGAESDKLPHVESWLKGFRDAELVVTNSFHGMMFSVINNTDFIIIGKETGGLSRISDFLDDFGIKNRFIEESELASVDLSKLKPIDWEKVNKRLVERRKESGDWLLDAVKQ